MTSEGTRSRTYTDVGGDQAQQHLESTTQLPPLPDTEYPDQAEAEISLPSLMVEPADPAVEAQDQAPTPEDQLPRPTSSQFPTVESFRDYLARLRQVEERARFLRPTAAADETPTTQVLSSADNLVTAPLGADVPGTVDDLTEIGAEQLSNRQWQQISKMVSSIMDLLLPPASTSHLINPADRPAAAAFTLLHGEDEEATTYRRYCQKMIADAINHQTGRQPTETSLYQTLRWVALSIAAEP